MAKPRASSKRTFFQDLTGQKFGRLTAIAYAGKKRNAHCWDCECECGGKWSGPAHKIRSGHVSSCGCAQTICILKHPDRKKYPAEARILSGAIKRCTDPKNPAHKDYGARGIGVCDRWKDGADGKTGLECFVEDMGRRPEGLSLERTDNEKGYEPGNCKWATRVEQCNNRRSNIWITVGGVTKNVTQWSQETGIKRGTLEARYWKGWPHEVILAPVDGRRKMLWSLGLSKRNKRG